MDNQDLGTTGGPAPTRVIIVDDDLFVRTALARLLSASSAIDVVGSYESGPDAITAAIGETPEIALVDISMPNMDGVETTRRLLEAVPEIRVLALTSLADARSASAMLAAGAVGFLAKDLPTQAMIDSILAARHGVSILAGVATTLITTRPDEDAPPLAEIERRILTLVVAGNTNEQIARLVYLSPSAVKQNVSTLMTKLHATNRVTLAVRAVELGIE